MRQRGALGEARGAAGELHVDRVARVQQPGDARHALVGRVAALDQIGKAHETAFIRTFSGHVNPDRVLQMRQRLRFERLAGLGVRPLGRQLAQHADVVAGLEARHGHQRLAIDLVQGVFDFGRAIGRVDVDQHQPRLGGGQLHQHPFGIVVRPDADAVARRQAQAQQGARQAVGLGLQLAVGVAALLVRHHQRLALGVTLDHGVEQGANGLLDQRRLGGTAGVAGRGGGGSTHDGGLR